MAEQTAAAPKTGGLYAHYVLGVLVVVYIFSIFDPESTRQEHP
jgi:hypothetical protein